MGSGNTDPISEIREKVIRIEVLLEGQLNSYNAEIPKVKERLSLLEQWRAKSMGWAAAVGAGASALVSYLIKHGGSSQ